MMMNNLQLEYQIPIFFAFVCVKLKGVKKKSAFLREIMYNMQSESHLGNSRNFREKYNNLLINSAYFSGIRLFFIPYPYPYAIRMRPIRMKQKTKRNVFLEL